MNKKEYPLPNEVGQKFSARSTTPLSLFHLNIQSARNKFDELNIFLDDFGFSFDFLMLTETWCRSDETMDPLDGYTVYDLNRCLKRGGGVCIYAKTAFECTVIDQLTTVTNDIEILTLESSTSILSVLYRPPNGNMDLFLEFIEKLYVHW